MPCERLSSVIDACFDGELDGQVLRDLLDHVEHCAECTVLHARETALRGALRALPVAEMRPGFAAAAFERARSAAPRRRRSPLLAAGVGVAAGVLFTLLAVFGLRAPSSTVPEVTIALEETRSVNLVFSTPQALADARLNLELPEGVELEGYEGRRALSFTTDLDAGKNVLRLPLIARAEPDGLLLATLEVGNDTKTFRLKVRLS